MSLSGGLPEALRFLRRGALLAVLMAVALGGLMYQRASKSPPVYRASMALLASQPSGGYGNLGLITPPPVDASVYKTALLQGPVASDALTTLLGKTPTPGQLRAFERSIGVSVQKQTISSIIVISVDDHNAKFASRAANALADSLMAWDSERARQAIAGTIQELERTVSDLNREIKGEPGGTPPSAATQKALTALRDQRERELAAARKNSESSVPIGLLEPLSDATTPVTPIGPRVAFKTLVAAVIGLILVYGWFFLLWTLDPRLRDRTEMAALSGLPILAEFPAKRRKGDRSMTEAANFLRSNVMLLTRSEAPVTIAVTSAHATRENAGVAVSLAASLARGGQRTLLVDADLRQPSRAYGLDVSEVNSTPFEVHLENASRRYPPVTVEVGAGRSFDFVPSFTSASYPVELLDRGMAELLQAWQESYDFIVVDCPPVLPFADTLTVARLCSGSVVCVSPGLSAKRDITESLERLQQIDARILGTVLTNARDVRQPRRLAKGSGPELGNREAVDPYKTLGNETGITNVVVKRR